MGLCASKSPTTDPDSSTTANEHKTNVKKRENQRSKLAQTSNKEPQANSTNEQDTTVPVQEPNGNGKASQDSTKSKAKTTIPNSNTSTISDNKNSNMNKAKSNTNLNANSNNNNSNNSNNNNHNNHNNIHSNNNHNNNSTGTGIISTNQSTNNHDNNNNSINSGNSSSNSAEKYIKVLLLGSGESGKSTIVKQMKILHQNGYTQEELYEYKPFVYRNVMECIKNIINAIIDLEPQLIKQSSGSQSSDAEDEIHDDVNEKDYSIGDSPQLYANGKPASRRGILDYHELSAILDYELTMSIDEPFDPKIAKYIDKVYKTPEVQHFLKYQQGNFYLIDSTKYFLSDVERIAQPDYFPSVNDILRTRKKTSGIFDCKFQMAKGLNIHMFDVGGQRSERKKWIHCFDNVTLIIFCVALSEYDQVLLEENSQNRLEESLTLFDSVVNSRWFSRSSIVLFLNKIDVFAEKLPYSPLENHFPDYSGGENINKAAKYILWRFTQVNKSGLNIYPHVTQATDTSNIELVFAAVKETILENSLRDSGLL